MRVAETCFDLGDVSDVPCHWYTLLLTAMRSASETSITVFATAGDGSSNATEQRRQSIAVAVTVSGSTGGSRPHKVITETSHTVN